MTESTRPRAPAKVNVHLGVGPLRPDGFHELRTVYLAVSLFDTVTVGPGDGLSRLRHRRGRGRRRVPTDRRNLVWRAAELLAAHAGVPADAAIDVAKPIPAAAGLAGGSADAAAALVALDALWGTRAGREDLAGLAAAAGQRRAVQPRRRGRPRLRPRGAAVAGAGPAPGRTGCSASRRTACRRRPSTASWTGCGPSGRVPRRHRASPRPTPVLAALRDGPAAGPGLARSRNDLQAPGAQPAPRAPAGRCAPPTDAGALAALVSGSGPTVAALAEDEDGAVRLAAELAGQGVFRTVRAVHGPGAGARACS